MKLVNKEEFLSLPNGIIYSYYEPTGNIEGLYTKTESLHNDWVYEDLIGDIDCGDTDFGELVLNIEDNREIEFRMDLECGRRDGMYKTQEMFVVYDEVDVRRLFYKLQMLMNNYPFLK